MDAIFMVTPATQDRFLSVYKQDAGLGPVVEHRSIEHGNTVAHDGHTLADANLYD